MLDRDELTILITFKIRLNREYSLTPVRCVIQCTGTRQEVEAIRTRTRTQTRAQVLHVCEVGQRALLSECVCASTVAAQALAHATHTSPMSNVCRPIMVTITPDFGLTPQCQSSVNQLVCQQQRYHNSSVNSEWRATGRRARRTAFDDDDDMLDFLLDVPTFASVRGCHCDTHTHTHTHTHTRSFPCFISSGVTLSMAFKIDWKTPEPISDAFQKENVVGAVPRFHVFLFCFFWAFFGGLAQSINLESLNNVPVFFYFINVSSIP